MIHWHSWTKWEYAVSIAGTPHQWRECKKCGRIMETFLICKRKG